LSEEFMASLHALRITVKVRGEARKRDTRQGEAAGKKIEVEKKATSDEDRLEIARTAGRGRGPRHPVHLGGKLSK
jgi:hypothetical protein